MDPILLGLVLYEPLKPSGGHDDLLVVTCAVLLRSIGVTGAAPSANAEVWLSQR